jgi:hypothetical protein
MSEHDINQNEDEVTVLDEADAASNMATIASKPTGISRSDLISKMVAYASSLDKETLAQAAETLGMSPDDIYDSNKAATSTGDNSAKNKASINSSNAAPAQPMTSVKEDLALIFGDSTDLSEDFKLKINTLFEAAVSTRVSIETTKLEESFEEAASELQTKFETDLEESVEKIQSEMLENVDNYINYAVAEWISENKLAIESGIRTEIAESFMLNLKNVFEQHYIDIPEDKVDVVESMAAELEEMKSRLNETTEKNIELSKVVNQKEVEDITTTFAEGMTDTQKDKFVKLTESINYSDSAEFRKKVSIIKETYFPTKSEVKVTEDQLLNESVEEPEKTPYVDPSMNNYVASISRTLKK